MTRENRLINRIRNGDADAWNELIEIYYSEILRYCFWHTADRECAEDAAQETFLKAIRYVERYVHRGKFKAFIYKIAANTCIDLSRKRSRTDVPLDNLEMEFMYVENGFKEIESDMALRQMVNELKQDLREVIILRYGQELSLREIADITDLPLRTVQSKINRGLKILKESVSEGRNK